MTKKRKDEDDLEDVLGSAGLQGGDNESTVAAQELRQIIEQIEHLEEEKKAISDDISEFYKAATGNELAGIDKEVFLNLFANKVTLSKAIFLPAGTPADVVKTYADTFKKIYADPEAKKALEAKVGAMNPNFGDDTNNAVRKGLKMDDASRAWLDQFVKRKFNVNL